MAKEPPLILRVASHDIRHRHDRCSRRSVCVIFRQILIFPYAEMSVSQEECQTDSVVRTRTRAINRNQYCETEDRHDHHSLEHSTQVFGIAAREIDSVSCMSSLSANTIFVHNMIKSMSFQQFYIIIGDSSCYPAVPFFLRSRNHVRISTRSTSYECIFSKWRVRFDAKLRNSARWHTTIR